jgi:hypothetical protein
VDLSPFLHLAQKSIIKKKGGEEDEGRKMYNDAAV